MMVLADAEVITLVDKANLDYNNWEIIIYISVISILYDILCELVGYNVAIRASVGCLV